MADSRCTDLQVRNPPGCGSDFSGDVNEDERVLFGGDCLSDEEDEQDEPSSLLQVSQHFVYVHRRASAAVVSY